MNLQYANHTMNYGLATSDFGTLFIVNFWCKLGEISHKHCCSDTLSEAQSSRTNLALKPAQLHGYRMTVLGRLCELR